MVNKVRIIEISLQVMKISVTEISVLKGQLFLLTIAVHALLIQPSLTSWWIHEIQKFF